ncbi:MAG TPA: glycosyltransferase [Candidatus Paceibacterota bacterium]|nr:glycosyltransferase [Candidatus Paceibacterota bacterium]
MKKILFVITKANFGGAQRYVYDLATSLPKEEFDVTVAFGARGRLAEMLEKADVKTHDISSLQRDVSFGADFRSFRGLVRLFKTLKPDVVHLNSSKVGGLGSLAARVAGVPNIIFTAHGWPFWEKRSRAARAAIWFASWATALLAHHVIVISDYDLRVARKMPLVGHKVVRIYNGIKPIDLGSGEKIRTAFPAGAKITGTIGELTKNKNQIALIERAAKHTDMYVAIVGEGELRGELEEKIRKSKLEERVKLFGFMPASEVLRGFDTFALPSIKEGLPYVLLEAKAAGLPIVANRVGGIGEILDSKDPETFSFDQMLEKTVALYRI